MLYFIMDTLTIWGCKLIMNLMALHTSYLNSPRGHKLFGQLFKIRIRAGEYKRQIEAMERGNK